MADVTVSSGRRWAADPLLLLGAVALAGAALLVGQLTTGELVWQPPALLGVVAAGLALSGST